MNSSRGHIRASTPKKFLPLRNKVLDAEKMEPISSISMLSEANTMYSEAAHGEIADLKSMVQALMTQMNHLVVNQNQASSIQQAPLFPACPEPFSLFTESTVNKDDSITSTKTITMESTEAPPPPPPPPMPNFALNSKQATLKIGQKTDKVLTHKQQPTLTDVLKELPKAKLRHIDR